MKYFSVAGEPSGDLHGSSLIDELKKSTRKLNLGSWRRFDACFRWSQAHKACQRNGLYGVLVSLEKFTGCFKNLRLCKSSSLNINLMQSF